MSYDIWLVAVCVSRRSALLLWSSADFLLYIRWFQKWINPAASNMRCAWYLFSAILFACDCNFANLTLFGFDKRLSIYFIASDFLVCHRKTWPFLVNRFLCVWIISNFFLILAGYYLVLLPLLRKVVLIPSLCPPLDIKCRLFLSDPIGFSLLMLV